MAFYGEMYAYHSAVSAFKMGKTLRYSQLRRLDVEDQNKYVKTRKILAEKHNDTYHYIGKCPTRGMVWAKPEQKHDMQLGPVYYFSKNGGQKEFLNFLEE